ncbi:MAG TPA: PSD1 and planctomycete cytochrome C domain-containing protein [Gemmataceae bacterium]|nr:PSD1 and planctomycete cytochrome C domain-containing protein [Gemmataceae bacterium]
MKRFSRLAVLLLPLCAPAAPAADALTFEKQVRPILKAYCFECHGDGDKLRGKLDLRLRRLIVLGGTSGRAVVPGKPDDSLLVQKVRAAEMPPGKKKLSAEETALLARWVAEGAKAAAEAKEVAAGYHINPEERAFWAFQPVHRPAIPKVKHPELVYSPIDAFLLAKLEEKGLSFSPPADKYTLIRRATLDLLGLPPAPEEVDAFLADDRLDAYERLIERVLASPQYGERWGRHWLDAAGYADSDGYTGEDPVRPYAYKYRDYVIRSLNADKPFDRFLQEQLAGDEMVRAPYRNLTPDDVEKLTATGFLRTAPDGTASHGVDQSAARNQVIADTLKIVSTSLMGLTVGCAQCHNHRYDPIPQSDYYRLRALFEPAYDPTAWRGPAQRLVSLYTDADRAAAARVEAEAGKIDAEMRTKQQEYIERTFDKEVAKLPESVREAARAARKTPEAKRTPEQQRLMKEHPSLNVSAGSLYLYDHKAAEDLKGYAERAGAVRAAKPVEDFVPVLCEVPGQVPATYLFGRGDPAQRKGTVEPGGLTILDSADPLKLTKDPSLPTTGRRLAFARWLSDGRHPLTARVLVNRTWMHHFGRGIVGTPGDFGFLGERPSHPELLEWLASKFVAGGWSLKHLHRVLMTSTAYRQSSRRGAAGEALDPDNRLLGRMPVRRLEAEAIRDAMLAISGRLNAKAFGKPVPVKTDGVGQIVVGVDNLDSAGYETGKGVLPPGEEHRRSVYVQVRRSRPLAVLEAFDAPVVEPNCEMRTASTVAPQALLLMNNAFVVGTAEAFAGRVRREAGTDGRARVVRAWRLAFGADPAEKDVREALAFLAEQEANFRARDAKADAPAQALASFCHALLSSNRFLYTE